MKKLSPFMQRFDELPDTLPVFPLPNVVVLPGGNLPLNIFEPRYLNMLQDAMESDRLIGMIQPLDDKPKPELYNVGCAGRITRYAETTDGRLEIQLTGLCRFQIKEELETTRGYRLIVPDWSQYEIDYNNNTQPDSEAQSAFISALRSDLNQSNMRLDWDSLEKLSVEELANGFFSYLSITADDKQMLLEIDTLEQRIKAITAILESNHQISSMRH